MSGIYIHIPFCKQACHYCNFHFSTSLKYKDDMVQAIMKEIDLSINYLDSHQLNSIYLGGGTPSLLETQDLKNIFDKLAEHYSWDKEVEITLEANPDDLNPDKIKEFTAQGINRWSLGIQSFSDRDLRFMNRAHQAEEALDALEAILRWGTRNITIDLIYGTPGLSDKEWEKHLSLVMEYEVPHLSCYALTVEAGTALNHFIKKGKTPPLDPEQARRQFEILMSMAEKGGYMHYEISNFAKPGYIATHNSNYWKSVPYLGIGPAAHSFSGNSRQWNVANNARYMKSIRAGEIPFEREHLSDLDRFNEYMMTGLRTMWGVDINKLKEWEREYFLKQIEPFIQRGYVVKKQTTYSLTAEGKHLADYIAMELFRD